VRPRKDLRDLVPRGGHTRRMIKLAKAIIAPSTSIYIESRNQQIGSLQGLCGNIDT